MSLSRSGASCARIFFSDSASGFVIEWLEETRSNQGRLGCSSDVPAEVITEHLQEVVPEESYGRCVIPSSHADELNVTYDIQVC